MGLIQQFLFGRRVEFQDIRLGILTARIKMNRPNSAVAWSGEHRFPGQPKDTGILLEGDLHGPSPFQVELVYRLLDGLDDLIPLLVKQISVPEMSTTYEEPGPLPVFFLAEIFPDKEANKLDITLEALVEEQGHPIYFVWDGTVATDLRAQR